MEMQQWNMIFRGRRETKNGITVLGEIWNYRGKREGSNLNFSGLFYDLFEHLKK